MNLSFF